MKLTVAFGARRVSPKPWNASAPDTPEVPKYGVLLTRGAELDLAELHRYVASTDSPESADRPLVRVLAAADRLASSPERGHIPGELQSLGIRGWKARHAVPPRTAAARGIGTRVSPPPPVRER